MQNLNAMTVFVRVAEARSFTIAARRLGISSSAASKSVSKLERELGVRLVNRTTRTVSLTDDGASFFARCRQILADIEEAEIVATQASTVPRGKLRVQLPVAFGRRVVVPALADFAARYPDMVVDIELSDRSVDLAKEGLDAAIRIGDLPDSRLIARRLCDIYFLTCASPDYLRKHGEPKTPDELDRHRCLTYVSPETGYVKNWRFARDGKQFGKAISGILNMNNAESILDVAVAGAGIAHLTNFVAADALATGKLKLVLRDYVAPGWPVSLVFLPSRRLSARMQVFLAFVRELVHLDGPWYRMLAPPVGEGRGQPAKGADVIALPAQPAAGTRI